MIVREEGTKLYPNQPETTADRQHWFYARWIARRSQVLLMIQTVEVEVVMVGLRGGMKGWAQVTVRESVES
jgi:hypothetical protein